MWSDASKNPGTDISSDDRDDTVDQGHFASEDSWNLAIARYFGYGKSGQYEVYHLCNEWDGLIQKPE